MTTRNVKEPKTERITLRVTPSQKNILIKEANEFQMPLSTYATDKLFGGKERNKYARRIMCTTLVTASNSIDEIFNEIEATNSDYIEISKILPPLNNARKECEKIWKY